MTMTDPIADMLTRLRNANSAYHDSVSMPSSSVKMRIATILQQEGYIAGFRVDANEDGVGKTLVLDLKYDKAGLAIAHALRSFILQCCNALYS